MPLSIFSCVYWPFGCVSSLENCLFRSFAHEKKLDDDGDFLLLNCDFLFVDVILGPLSPPDFDITVYFYIVIQVQQSS